MEASNRLTLTLQVLTKASHHTPGIQRSIAHLRQRLDRPRQPFSDGTSGATTPTTAHPLGQPSGIPTRPAAQPRRDEIPLNNVFNLLPLGAGFEELFASLQPEYAPDSLVDRNTGSTADLPMMREDWLSAFEL